LYLPSLNFNTSTASSALNFRACNITLHVFSLQLKTLLSSRSGTLSMPSVSATAQFDPVPCVVSSVIYSCQRSSVPRIGHAGPEATSDRENCHGCSRSSSMPSARAGRGNTELNSIHPRPGESRNTHGHEIPDTMLRYPRSSLSVIDRLYPCCSSSVCCECFSRMNYTYCFPGHL